jgi:deoxyribose-phosphate aldolase
MTGDAIAKLIDHTLLKPEATRRQIETLCGDAARYRFATVCVNPVWVALAARVLSGSGVGVCAVAGFPLGAAIPEVKIFEARRAIEDGAREIDMVINVGALKSGDRDGVLDDIRGVTTVSHDARALVKVIDETALLTDEETAAASALSKLAGADFVKTSTGFAARGATVEDVALIRRVIGPAMGIKAAGGVRTLAQLQALVRAGATRIGTSAGIEIVREAAEQSGQ